MDEGLTGGGISRLSSDGGVDPLEWPRRSGNVAAVAREIEAFAARRRNRRRAAWGAGVAALAAVGLLLFEKRPAEDATFVPSAPPRVEAASGSQVLRLGRQVFSDGSAIELTQGAGGTASFLPSARRVMLMPGPCQAFFEVGKDRDRPFGVYLKGVAVQALGTAFSVKLTSSQLEVNVTEGRVSVEGDSAPGAPAARCELAFVNAGSRLVLDTKSGAWEEDPPGSGAPMLGFDGTPLSRVVDVFNGHNRTRLVLAEPSVGYVRISGTIRADNIEGLRKLVASSFDIGAQPRGENELVLYRTAR